LSSGADRCGRSELIDTAGSYLDKSILTLLSRAGQCIGDWSPVAGRHGVLGVELEDVDYDDETISELERTIVQASDVEPSGRDS
jgi:hypothetical protein